LPDDRLPGEALATRRAVGDIVRRVTLGSYGVIDVAGRWPGRWLAALAGRPSGVRVSLPANRIEIDLRLQVAHGVPIAEVARQVDSAVRFAIRRAFRREIDRLSIRVGSVAAGPMSEPPRSIERAGPGSSDLADSGTDVA
jgi:uncharacterized alkaline shock family protein YloU